MNLDNLSLAPAISKGIEDKFYYTITNECIACGLCKTHCPVDAISQTEDGFQISSQVCIDCGTCSAICPTGAASRLPFKRESIRINDIDWGKCYFNPGCALSLYKPEGPLKMLELLQRYFGGIKYHNICCRHKPLLEKGATIINNCAGCDRRFRSLYSDIQTISYWEIIDSIQDLKLPDYAGFTVSIHDSCGYRHKPQVHNAIRSLLRKMNINIVECEFSGTESICCGDNFYGYVPNEQVENRIKMRADQFPCDDIVVYCIGCIRAMEFGGKKPHYLPDLLFERKTERMKDTLDEYHSKLQKYIDEH